jgi:cGMP-dependent protein kinase 1
MGYEKVSTVCSLGNVQTSLCINILDRDLIQINMGTGCMKFKEYSQIDNIDPNINKINRVPKKIKKSQVYDENALSRDISKKLKSSLNNRESSAYVEAASGEILRDAVKTQEDRQKIVSALNNHFIFTSLTDEDKEMVAEAMELYQFPPESIVFMQDMPSKSYYVVRTGILEVIVNGKRVNKIHPGEGFGELALLHDNPRSATLKCLEFTTLWGVERQHFRKVIEEMNTKIYEQNREFLEKVALLSSLTSLQKDSLAASLVSYKYYSGQKIITEGETGNQLFIVKEGVVSVQKGTQEVAKYHAGGYFGEMALLNNAPRSATCVAVEGPVKCMCLSRETLQRTLKDKLQYIIEKNTIMEAINKSETLSQLNKEQKEKIFGDIHERNYKGGDVVIPMGSLKKSKIYIIISGRLQFARTSLSFADKGTCVGDEYITKSHEEDSKYEDDLIASNDMKVGEMTKYQFDLSIGGRYEEVVKENAATNILKKVSLFTSLDTHKMKKLFEIIRIEKYTDSKIILSEGLPSASIYVVKRGKVDVFKAGTIIKTITKHDYFGERGILNNSFSQYTYVASGNLTLWVISNMEFANLINDKMTEQLNLRIKYEDETSTLQDLTVLKKIGKGMFAKVYLVRTRNNDFYALKAVSRRKINKFAINEQLIVIFN